jgi:chemotaxis protein methyltransferase CheR
MRDAECVALLQWALVRLRMRWRGFRRVRRQVCKRIRRRCTALGIEGAVAYRRYLEAHPDEWAVLDGLCRIPISRFYRDLAVFDALRRRVLPSLASAARGRGGAELRAWSAGCASGEEPYSLMLAWRLDVGRSFPGLAFRVLATDADARMLARARAASYGRGSLRDLPPGWVDAAFVGREGRFLLRPDLREGVEFSLQDIRGEAPDGPFDLVLVRNGALTYFEEDLQRQVLERVARRIVSGGALVVGAREALPSGLSEFRPWSGERSVYRVAGAR